MAVVILTPKEFDYNGVEAYSDTDDYEAATAVDGFEFLNDGKTLISIKNDSGEVALTVTVDVPNSCDFGISSGHDQEVAIPAGDDYLIGPFPTHIFNNQSTGKVVLTLSAYTDVSACAFKF
jgi:hypothetical protein